MRIISLLNLKGGTGKTVTTINLAAYLEKAGARVLIVDADSQCNSSDFFGAARRGKYSRSTLYDVLTDFRPLPEPQETSVPCIDILPGSDDLMDLDLGDRDAIKLTALSSWLAAQRAHYDYVLIDCPPAFTVATLAALRASTDVLIPTKLDAFSLSGMANLLHQIDAARTVNRSLHLLGVLPTMYHAAEYMDDSLDALQSHGLTVLNPIPRSDKVEQMTYEGEPLTVYSPRSGPGRAYKALAAAIRGGEQRG